jgi:hypothetical protein
MKSQQKTRVNAGFLLAGFARFLFVAGLSTRFAAAVLKQHGKAGIRV